MRVSFYLLLTAVCVSIAVGCNNATNHNELSVPVNNELRSSSDSTSNIAPSSAAARVKRDANRKFIKTADLKFKVDSVIAATYKIEDIAGNNGGFVTFSNITNEATRTESTQVSADSVLKRTYYNLVSDIVIRVPDNKLDTTLKSIAGLVNQMGYRVVKATDVSLDELSNMLSQKRNMQNVNRITNAIDNRGKKLNETIAAEDQILDKQETIDNAMMDNLSLNDKVKFSTVTIALFQNESITNEMISSPKEIKEYKIPFDNSLVAAFSSGWNIFLEIVLVIARLWLFIIFAIGAMVIYKKYFRKNLVVK